MKKGIIVVSFGTSRKEARKLCIESIENKVRASHKDFLVLRAFTSQMVINILKKREDYKVLNPKEALEKMKEEGIKDIYIQSLHILEGYEYEKLLRQVEDFHRENQDISVKVAKPLLYEGLDYGRIVDALGLEKPGDKEALVFMGHGTSHKADKSYKKMEKAFQDKGYERTFIATLEGAVGLEDLLPKLRAQQVEKIFLRPFMLVTGVHVMEDMVAKDEGSWKSILEKEGFKVEPVIKGLGEIEKIQELYLENLAKILA